MRILKGILFVFLLFPGTIVGQNDYDKKIRESKERIDSIISKERKLLTEKIIVIDRMVKNKEISEYTANKMKRDLSSQTKDSIQNKIKKERNKIIVLLKEKREVQKKVIEEKLAKQDSIYKYNNTNLERELEMAVKKLDSLFATESEAPVDVISDDSDSKYQDGVNNGIQDINILGLVRITKNGGEEERTEINIFPTPKRSKRTISGSHIALGFHTLNSAGNFGSDKFKVWGSKSFEIGGGRSTRIFKNSELLRVNYGYSFMFNKLKMKGDDYFVNKDGVTSIQPYPLDTYKSKFRATYLILPVSLELNLGGYYDYKEREYNRGFRLGIGAYVGGLLTGKQKVKYYNENGKRSKDVSYNKLSTNDWVYGLSAHIGYRNKAIYAKYSLVPLFRNNPVNEYPLSFGIRWGL
ncbi:porin family protein [Capnocytophaga stomatis]|uniref:Outer membrane protein beta-barrel domain-containing protein n=1 Tax=Capnocytophaga stomatis TaxID=1848904 RepID=A0ABW8QB51_9FLAO